MNFPAKTIRPELDDALLIELGDEFAATAAGFDETGEFPYRNVERLAAHGLLKLTVPAAYGGPGGTLADACRLVEALGRGEASTALIVAMNLIMHHVVGQDRPPAYEEVARAALAGRGILNALRAEPELGSVSRGGLPATVARQQPDGSWRISGHKAYGTGSAVVQWWLVWARTEEEQPRVGRWLVPSDAPGVTVRDNWNHLGMRATASHDIILQDVAVPASSALNLNLPADPAIARRAALLETWNGLLLAALYQGVARSGRDWIVKFLHERKPSNLGASLATVPRLQGIVGEIEALLFTNRSVLAAATAEAEAAERPDPARANLVKHLVTGNAVRALELALSISGNHGLHRGNPLERNFRDALCGRVHAPQSDSILVNAGRSSLRV